ncbi:hypothetical protein HOY82DRAFT_616358 [Tuber indicum]|nr:hypothetical protein HOY82DRAFT_616358 [Tuber indicum]
MDDLILTTGNLKITIKGGESDRRSAHRHRHRQGEDTGARYTQPHHGAYSQNPAGSGGEYVQGQGYPKLTAQNLAIHERLESGNHAPQAYSRQEDDTAAQCGQRYPEEHRHRSRRSGNTTAHAGGGRSTHHAAYHGYGQEPGHYQGGPGYAMEGERTGGGYVNQTHAQPHYYGATYGAEYQDPHTHHAAYYQPDRLELGQKRVVSNRPPREEGSRRRRTGGDSHSRDSPEWVLCQEGSANAGELEEYSIPCEIEEVE